MTNVTRARPFKSRLRLARLERLENREVLSADMGLGHLPVTGSDAAVVAPTRGVEHFEISITGTQVSYSPAGLPTDMKGTVYLDTAAGASAASIGTYDETLLPIFMPVGPNGALAFVGATGICTFDFDLSLGSPTTSVTLGSITAADTALIEGARPDGTILVGSSSSPITAATGICHGLTGSFNGQSEVVMGATFSMHTIVDFTVTNRGGVDIEEVLNELVVANSAFGRSYIPQNQDPSPRDDILASHADLPGADGLAHKYEVIEHVFAYDSDHGWDDLG
ncbi:MAG TPA: hypothetical protein VND64_15495 [Pirellulales bacterium]|nr:hypothetical protein [Pirellulales bacterium]